MPTTQTYANHHRYTLLYHYVALPILGVNLIVTLVQLIRAPSLTAGWGLLVAVALAALVASVRVHGVTLQDRIIRLEERLRLERCLPADLRGRIAELSTAQLIALRFCPDDELAELTRAALAESLGPEEIKKRIKNWRPDYHRV
jgi:hypothetical protein